MRFFYQQDNTGLIYLYIYGRDGKSFLAPLMPKQHAEGWKPTTPDWTWYLWHFQRVVHKGYHIHPDFLSLDNVTKDDAF